MSAHEPCVDRRTCGTDLPGAGAAAAPVSVAARLLHERLSLAATIGTMLERLRGLDHDLVLILPAEAGRRTAIMNAIAESDEALITQLLGLGDDL